MKTTDLIPLILLELNENDKYGFELTKAIETKSNGKIVLKQPTLYTVLKKLEKNKFISSYWQDSDIGGKRHYYKITDNGKSLVSTLPSYSTLIDSIEMDDNDALDESSNPSTFVEPDGNLSNDATEMKNEYAFIDEPKAQEQSSLALETDMQETSSSLNENYSIMDLLTPTKETETSSAEVKETILPTQVVFDDDSLDTATSAEVNLNNVQILKEEKTNTNENFATNENVTKFVENSVITDEYKSKLTSAPTTSYEAFDFKPVNNPNIDDIKFVEYQNFKTNAEYIYTKKYIKSTTLKVLTNSLYLLAMIVLSSIVVSFTKTSTLYYIFLILGIICLIFYPALTALYLNKIRQKGLNLKKIDLKKYVIFAVAFMLLTFIICIIYSIVIGNNSIVAIFGIKNFANLYAPLLIASVSCINILTNYLFMIKKLK